jgi:hypothetical protein
MGMGSAEMELYWRVGSPTSRIFETNGGDWTSQGLPLAERTSPLVITIGWTKMEG